MKITSTGKSIRELIKKYGIGATGFYPDNWYKDESFVDECPDKGEYEIVLDKKSVNKTYKEQTSELAEGFSPVHPALVVEAVLSHYKKTGERLLENWYVRTSSLVSGGDRVLVGGFDSDGLRVYYCFWDGYRYDNVGLSAARKLLLKTGSLETPKSLTFEARVAELERKMRDIHIDFN